MPGEIDVANWSTALSGSEARAVIDASSRAVIVTTPDGTIVMWNRSAEDLYGWAEGEVLGRSIAEVLVPVGARTRADEIMAALLAGDRWQGDFTVLHRNGDVVRAYVVDTPVVDADGTVLAIVGASEDVTARRALEHQAADLAEHLSLALEAGELGTWRWDIATGATTWDAKVEALFGLEPGTFDGTYSQYVSLLHPDDAPAVLAAVQRAVDEKTRYTTEHRVIWPDGTVRWLQGKGRVTLDESGQVTGTMGCVADVTEQATLRMERERALESVREAAEQQRVNALRLSFLSEINDALAASTTRADVMRNVTRTAVPALGDWCAIHLLPDGGSPVPETEAAHVDPTQLEFVKALQQRLPHDPQAASGIAHVIRTGESEFYPFIDDQVLADVPTTDEARDAVRALAMRSAIAVPLAKGGRVFGALQFVNFGTSRAYTLDDLTLAKAVASRIAATLENKRLSELQRTIAITLQASLLPDTLPVVPDVDVAVRYWAAGEGAIVGGDFYDLFEIDHDHWAVVIGDVCGTGPAAASLTGLARHTIRAATWNGADPGDVLRQLNHAVRRSGRQTFCTTLYCTLARDADGFRLTVTSGGHPLPVVRRADGRVETIGTPGTLLGAIVQSRSTTVTAQLRGGDAVVLYTDGITDLRPPHGLTAEQMETMVGEAAARADSAEAVATALGIAIDDRLSFSDRDDDIAMLVLHVSGIVSH